MLEYLYSQHQIHSTSEGFQLSDVLQSPGLWSPKRKVNTHVNKTNMARLNVRHCLLIKTFDDKWPLLVSNPKQTQSQEIISWTITAISSSYKTNA